MYMYACIYIIFYTLDTSYSRNINKTYIYTVSVTLYVF